MSELLIKPHALKGMVRIPPSKSMAHRAIIAASLAHGQSTIDNVQLSDDIIATMEGMRSWGTEIQVEPNEQERVTLRIEGNGGRMHASNADHYQIDANESGSTLRFLIPLATLFGGRTHFIGRGQLGQRPLAIYEEIFREQGLYYENNSKQALDLTVGGQLAGGVYQVAGDVSSQFITGLLYTLPLLIDDSVIEITGELESVGYIYLTLEMLAHYGIQIEFNEEAQTLSIPGRQRYQAYDYTVEGDYSQAAFFLVAGAIGNDVVVQGLDRESQQGDQEIIEFLDQLKASTVSRMDGLQTQSERLVGGVVLDGAQSPDVIPVLAVAACLAEGHTEIVNLSRLRIKESDRLVATAKELSAIGAQIQVVGDTLQIDGVESFKGGVEVSSHQDHRIAMMLAIASTRCQEPITLLGPGCVSKSYPHFWADFEQLGGDIA